MGVVLVLEGLNLERQQWRELQDHVKAVDGYFIAVHVSGHIYRDDLIAFVRQVSPQIVVPCHTFEPDAFGEHFPNLSGCSRTGNRTRSS